MMTGTSGRSPDPGQHFQAAHAGHVDIRQDQDQRLLDGAGNARQRVGRRQRKVHRETLRAQVAPEMLTKQRFDVRFVVDNQHQNVHV
jgi:hypothetical protein